MPLLNSPAMVTPNAWRLLFIIAPQELQAWRGRSPPTTEAGSPSEVTGLADGSLLLLPLNAKWSECLRMVAG